jgi:hypothetical protein
MHVFKKYFFFAQLIPLLTCSPKNINANQNFDKYFKYFLFLINLSFEKNQDHFQAYHELGFAFSH